ncbi:GtrA family protein [Stenotrophomonas sp. G106K1]|uniref:GtrA family protein n=1 Tax=Stenotrophomonas sp. G106K1 TaxID=3134792 RepID=UPI0030F472EE
MVVEIAQWRSWSQRLSVKTLRSLAGEMGRFGLVGGIQLVVDWALFVALSWAGLGVVPSNLVSRAGGAAFGYWLNGKYTFAGGSGLGRNQMIRFVVTWIVMSVLSSAIVWIVGHKAGLGWAWLVKPAGDAALALLSFFISKHWIYR